MYLIYGEQTIWFFIKLKWNLCLFVVAFIYKEIGNVSFNANIFLAYCYLILSAFYDTWGYD